MVVTFSRAKPYWETRRFPKCAKDANIKKETASAEKQIHGDGLFSVVLNAKTAGRSAASATGNASSPLELPVGHNTMLEDRQRLRHRVGLFSHDHARSRAATAGRRRAWRICDRQQFICFALALWNGKDPLLKNDHSGLTGNEGNHGEDVKEYYLPSRPDADPLRCEVFRHNAQREALQSTCRRWKLRRRSKQI